MARRHVLGVLAIGLLLTGSTACGGGRGAAATGGLDCRSIDFIVPYAPGGGSDRQVRRMQPHLEESLGAQINVAYMEGGDGAIGWQALTSKRPDGCAVSNVVAPNIMLLSTSGQNVGFTAEDFAYVAWTETTPNVLAVAADSPYRSVDDFVQAAKAAPGSLTVAGVGEVGALLAAEVENSTGAAMSYVPVSGGVGEIVPALLGGHVDAAVIGAAHVAESDGSMRALAMTGDKRVPSLPDVPTYEEAGYGPATLGQSWGIIAPPGTPAEVVETWNGAVRDAIATEESAITEAGLIPLRQSPQEARSYMEQMYESLKKAQETVRK
jgi:tripartite-type tricarboxylate transporter receptor subunit TctC